MNSNPVSYTTIDEYIATFPEDIQAKLKQIRAVIKATAPEATEKISYQVPTFYLHGNLVHFAAFKQHISFFPSSSGVRVFEAELSPYETSKGTIKFPLDKPMPLDLIRRITEFRVMENLEKAKTKSSKKN